MTQRLWCKECSVRLCLPCAGHGSFPPIDCVPDTVNGVRFVRDLYEMSDDTSGTANIASSCSRMLHIFYVNLIHQSLPVLKTIEDSR